MLHILDKYLTAGECYEHTSLKAAYFRACNALDGVRFRLEWCALSKAHADFFERVLATRHDSDILVKGSFLYPVGVPDILVTEADHPVDFDQPTLPVPTETELAPIREYRDMMDHRAARLAYGYNIATTRTVTATPDYRLQFTCEALTEPIEIKPSALKDWDALRWVGFAMEDDHITYNGAYLTPGIEYVCVIKLQYTTNPEARDILGYAHPVIDAWWRDALVCVADIPDVTDPYQFIAAQVRGFGNGPIRESDKTPDTLAKLKAFAAAPVPEKAARIESAGADVVVYTLHSLTAGADELTTAPAVEFLVTRERHIEDRKSILVSSGDLNWFALAAAGFSLDNGAIRYDGFILRPGVPVPVKGKIAVKGDGFTRKVLNIEVKMSNQTQSSAHTTDPKSLPFAVSNHLKREHNLTDKTVGAVIAGIFKGGIQKALDNGATAEDIWKKVEAYDAEQREAQGRQGDDQENDGPDYTEAEMNEIRDHIDRSGGKTDPTGRGGDLSSQPDKPTTTAITLPPTGTDAPFSSTIKAFWGEFDVMFSVRAASFTDGLDRTNQLLARLEAEGYTPTRNRTSTQDNGAQAGDERPPRQDAPRGQYPSGSSNGGQSGTSLCTRITVGHKFSDPTALMLTFQIDDLDKDPNYSKKPVHELLVNAYNPGAKRNFVAGDIFDGAKFSGRWWVKWQRGEKYVNVVSVTTAGDD